MQRTKKGNKEGVPFLFVCAALLLLCSEIRAAPFDLPNEYDAIQLLGVSDFGEFFVTRDEEPVLYYIDGNHAKAWGPPTWDNQEPTADNQMNYTCNLMISDPVALYEKEPVLILGESGGNHVCRLTPPSTLLPTRGTVSNDFVAEYLALQGLIQGNYSAINKIDMDVERDLLFVISINGVGDSRLTVYNLTAFNATPLSSLDFTDYLTANSTSGGLIYDADREVLWYGTPCLSSHIDKIVPTILYSIDVSDPLVLEIKTVTPLGSNCLSSPFLDPHTDMVWWFNNNTAVMGFRSDGSWSSKSIVVEVGARATAIDPYKKTAYAWGGIEFYGDGYLNAFCLADPLPPIEFYADNIPLTATGDRLRVIRRQAAAKVTIYGLARTGGAKREGSVYVFAWVVEDVYNACPGHYPSQSNYGAYRVGDFGEKQELLKLDPFNDGYALLREVGVNVTVTGIHVDEERNILWVVTPGDGFLCLNLSSEFAVLSSVPGTHDSWADHWARPMVTHYYQNHSLLITIDQDGGIVGFLNGTNPSNPTVRTLTLPSRISHMALDEVRGYLYVLSYGLPRQKLYVVEVDPVNKTGVAREDLYMLLKNTHNRTHNYCIYDSHRHMLYMSEFAKIGEGLSGTVAYLSLKGDLANVNATVFYVETGNAHWAPAFVHPYTRWPWFWDRVSWVGNEFSVDKLGSAPAYNGRRYLPAAVDFSGAIVDEMEGQVYWVMASGGNKDDPLRIMRTCLTDSDHSPSIREVVKFNPANYHIVGNLSFVASFYAATSKNLYVVASGRTAILPRRSDDPEPPSAYYPRLWVYHVNGTSECLNSSASSLLDASFFIFIFRTIYDAFLHTVIL